MEEYILIADDDLDDRTLIAEAFEASDLVPELRFVQDGEEVLVFLQDQQVLPKFILLDLNMPKKSGYKVLEELKKSERFSPVPIIIYSTSADEFTVTKCYQMGANCFITKPADYQQIVNLARSIIKFWLGIVRLPKG